MNTPIPETPIRVALYIRVSTVDQTNGFSLDTQKNDLIRHVERNEYRGWVTRPEWHFVEQASGASMERGALNRLLEMVKQRKFDIVLVWKLDRISRNLSDLLSIFDCLNQHDVGFVSFMENVDFSNAIGKLMFGFFGLFSEFERSTIMLRTSEGKKTSAIQGNYVGGGVPYGFKRVPNLHGKGSKLQLIEGEGQVVKMIFDMFVNERKTVTEIAHHLDELGISKGEASRSTAYKTKWKDTTVRNMLKNFCYIGQSITNRFKIINKKPKRWKENPRKDWIVSEVTPVLISPSLFYAAQDLLVYGRKGKRGGGREVYMLAGRLIDVVSGKGFIGYKSGKDTKNYRRKRFVDRKTGVVFPTMSIAAAELERFVWSIVENAILQPELFLKKYEENSHNYAIRRSLDEHYAIYRKQHLEALERVKRVKSAFFDGKILEAERNEFLLEYESQVEAAGAKLQDLERQLSSNAAFSTASTDLKKFSELMKQSMGKLSYEQKAHVVKMLVEKVEIKESSTERVASIFFRFDPKVVVSTIPEGRTDLALVQAKKQAFGDEKVSNGGR